VVKAEAAGSAERPGITADPAVDLTETGVPSGSAPYYPPGLTPEGREAFRRLREDNARRFERRLGRELALDWLELKVDGPEEFTRDRVEKAHEALLKKDRLDIENEARPKIRAEVVEELQQARNLHQQKARRAIQRWALGSAVGTTSTATIAVLGIPSGNDWAKLALVAGSVFGALVTRPPHR
jgi:hypothetical protein